MKKTCLMIAVSMIMVMLAGCGKKAENTQIANPWTDSDRQGVLKATGFDMEAPEDATDVHYSYMAETKLAQLQYVKDGNDWVYRIQPSDSLTDISGMNYEWGAEDEDSVCGLEAVYMSYSDATEDTEYLDDTTGVQVVYWYDDEAKVSYSLSVSGDTNGIDLQVYAEEMYTASK